MPWNERLPSTFPKRYSEAVKAAFARPGRSIILSTHRSLADAQQVADRFRHFRWCIRRAPKADPDLYNIECQWRLRTAIEKLGEVFILYLTAYSKPSLEALNPHLSDCFDI